MPSIDITQPHTLPMPEARSRIDRVAARMREKFDTDSHWDGDTLRFARTGVKGSIALAAQSVLVHADLGLMLTPLKGVVEQEIRRKLQEEFG